MKLSKETMTILGNFSKINPEIVFRPGSVIRTISDKGGILAEATISESLPKECGISDLAKFLSVQELMPEAELNFNESEVEIVSDNRKIKYVYADIENIKSFNKSLNVPAPEISFEIKSQLLAELTKISYLLNAPHFVIKSEKGRIVVSAEDTVNNGIGTYKLDIGVATDRDFKFIMKLDNFQLVDGDYSVECTKKEGPEGDVFIASFINKTLPVKYWVALEYTGCYLN